MFVPVKFYLSHEGTKEVRGAELLGGLMNRILVPKTGLRKLLVQQ